MTNERNVSVCLDTDLNRMKIDRKCKDSFDSNGKTPFKCIHSLFECMEMCEVSGSSCRLDKTLKHGMRAKAANKSFVDAV